jgi:hypothetical protein
MFALVSGSISLPWYLTGKSGFKASQTPETVGCAQALTIKVIAIATRGSRMGHLFGCFIGAVDDLQIGPEVSVLLLLDSQLSQEPSEEGPDEAHAGS